MVLTQGAAQGFQELAAAPMFQPSSLPEAKAMIDAGKVGRLRCWRLSACRPSRRADRQGGRGHRCRRQRMARHGRPQGACPRISPPSLKPPSPLPSKSEPFQKFMTERGFGLDYMNASDFGVFLLSQHGAERRDDGTVWPEASELTMLRVSDLVSPCRRGHGLAIFLRAKLSIGGRRRDRAVVLSGVDRRVLTLLGIVLAASTVLRRRALPIAGFRSSGCASPRTLVAVLSVPVSILAMGCSSPRLGLSSPSMLVTTGLLLAFRIRAATNLVIAACLTLVLYLVFVRLLHVPLPAGLIEGMLP